MKAMIRKPTRRRLESALETLLLVTETADLSGQQRDDISRVRHLLHKLLDSR